MIATLLGFFVAGLIALVVLSVVLAVVGLIFSLAAALAGFLLFKVAPIVLVGYLVVRFLAPRHKRISNVERKWIEG